MQHFQAVCCPAEVKQKLSPSPGQLEVEEEEEVEVCIVHSSLPNVALIPATPAQPSAPASVPPPAQDRRPPPRTRQSGASVRRSRSELARRAQ